MQRIKEFWLKYETKIVLAIGFILIAGLAFEGGYLHGKTQKESLLVVEKAPECPKNEAGNAVSPETDKTASSQQKAPADNLNSNQADCAYVGSKNSDKYHLPTCRFAKNIKPENLVCFKSIEDATQKGYQPDKTCIK